MYIVLRVNENGYREMFGFYIGGQETALGWQEILQALYQRGVKEVLLGVFDDLNGLEEAFQSVYPKAEYTTNAIERTIKDVRKRLKTMNSLTSKESAEKITYLTIQDFDEKWSNRKLRGFSNAYSKIFDLLNFVTSRE